MGIKMVGNGIGPFPCGSERGKTLFQTREVDEKKETAVEERSTDSDRGIQKIVGNQMLNHAGV